MSKQKQLESNIKISINNSAEELATPITARESTTTPITNKNSLASNIIIMNIDDVIPYSRNPRNISNVAISKVASSIKEFGFLNPIIIDKNNVIIAGHTRLKACYKLGLKRVPVIKADKLTPNQIKAYRVADNRTSEETTWNRALLAIEINDLKIFNDHNPNENLNIALTGFDLKELETLNNLTLLNKLDSNLLNSEQTEQTNYEQTEQTERTNSEQTILDTNNYKLNYSNIPNLNNTGEPITRTGDLWLLGNHRLLCDDATNLKAVNKLMNSEVATMVFTDPPYNVKINDICGIGKTQHEEFAMASGEMSEEEFINFLTTVFNNYLAITKAGSIHYICMDWKHIFEIITAGRNTYTKKGYKQLCVWNKDNSGMGTFYRSKYELIFIFKNGTQPNTNNFELGQYGRHRTNVWDYPAINSFAGREMITNEAGKKMSGTSKELVMHPTVKPLRMVIDAILDCSNENELIADFFLGSGTTLIAAEQTNRICYGMELSPKYCDTIIKRFIEETNLIGQTNQTKQIKHTVILEATGQTFAEIEMERREEQNK